MSEIWSKIFIGLHVKYRLFLSDFSETWIFSTGFRKTLNTKFHENPFSGSRVVQCGRKDGRTDITNPTSACRSFANTPMNENPGLLKAKNFVNTQFNIRFKIQVFWRAILVHCRFVNSIRVSKDRTAYMCSVRQAKERLSKLFDSADAPYNVRNCERYVEVQQVRCLWQTR
jgi:hypothetical protein